MKRVGAVAFTRKKSLRKSATKSELLFMSILLKYSIPFHFQKIVYTPYNFFFLDFLVSMKPRTIFEIDGKIHLSQKTYDAYRDKLIKSTSTYRKYKIIRIKNEEVFSGEAERIIRKMYPKKSRLVDNGAQPSPIPKKYQELFSLS